MHVRFLDADAAMRFIELVRDGVEPPKKIRQHKERIVAAEKQLAFQRRMSGGLVAQSDAYHVEALKMELDELYCDWAQGIERICWCDIAGKADITPDQILRESVFSTERDEASVYVLASYLDEQGHVGISKELARRYLIEIRPLLAEAIALDDEAVRMFEDPRTFFKTTDDDKAATKTVEYFNDHAYGKLTQHVCRALIAHIEFGLGEYCVSLVNAGVARSSKRMEDFCERYAAGDSRAISSHLVVERRWAEILIDLLNEARKP